MMIDLCVADIENKLYENGLIEGNDRVKFITGNYALVEKHKNEYYMYYAVNTDTLKGKLISKRRNPILQESYEKIAQKLNELNYNNINLKITKYDRAYNLLSHIFSYILPNEGFSFRQNQHDLALEMLESLETKTVAMMEAEVGTGKTHAYIIAVIIYNIFHNVKDTTIISTSTVALQKAITEEYIPQISNILMKYRIIRKPLDFTVRKGKAHYICDIKFKTYLANLERNNFEKDEQLLKVMRILAVVNEQYIDLDAYPLTRYVKDKISVTKCNELCSKYNNCRFISFVRNCISNKYYFQIANHNYVFADILGYKSLLPQYKVIVFDEAHKLYNAAKQMFGCYISVLEFTDLIQDIEESKARPLKFFCNSINSNYQKLFYRLTGLDNIKENFVERHEANIDYFCGGYIENIIKLLDNISATVYNCDEIRLEIKKHTIKKKCDSIKNKLKVFTQPEYLICWTEYDGTSNCLCSIPKDMYMQIYSTLWNRDVSSILTSGTLSAAGDFSLTKNNLGIDLLPPDKISEASKRSPFDYKKNALIYIPEYIPFPNITDSEYVSAVTSEIDRLIKVTYGHSLILFTSYRLMEIVFNNLCKNEYSYPLFVMGRGRIDALKDFKISGNGVLFASDSAGEGVDIVGDTLSNLIIVKLPFAVPDPIAKYEQSVVGGLNAYLKKINTPNMIIKLKQYVGRLIRSEKDTGVVAILDSRVNSEGKYRKIVLDSLFNAPVTNKISDVEQFVIDKKDDTYFA